MVGIAKCELSIFFVGIKKYEMYNNVIIHFLNTVQNKKQFCFYHIFAYYLFVFYTYLRVYN